MFAPVRLIILFAFGLFFLYAGLLNPLVMVSPDSPGGLYKNYGVGGVRAGELALGLVLTLGSGWLIRRERRRARQRQGPSR